MSTETEIEFITGVFSRVIAHEDHRNAIGAAIRNHMHEQLALGVKIDHYRSDWLHRSVNEVIDVLEHIGHEFNVVHPDDKCTTADLADIATSVVTTLRHYMTHGD